MPAPTCQFCGRLADVAVRTIGEALTPEGVLFVGADPAPQEMRACVACVSKHGEDLVRLFARKPSATLLEATLAELELERTKKS